MLSGHSLSLPHRVDSGEIFLKEPVSSIDEESGDVGMLLYRASFEELVANHLQYDMIIWVLISLLLILAWGVGVLMLLYFPVRRYVLHKELLSRKLHVTDKNIVYKATRPSLLPFMGSSNIEMTVPLHLVLDVVIEKGCLQSWYGLCTFRIESISHGQTSLVDELQFQGVSNPEILRKVIVAEASKKIIEAESWKPLNERYEGYSAKGFTTSRALMEAPSSSKSQFSYGKFRLPSTWHVHSDGTSDSPDDILFNKLEGIDQSVKMLEPLVMRLRMQTQEHERGSNAVTG